MSSEEPILAFSDLVDVAYATVGQALDPAQRLSQDTDEIILGKLLMLELIGTKARTYVTTLTDEADLEFHMGRIEEAIVRLQGAAAPKTRARKSKS